MIKVIKSGKYWKYNNVTFRREQDAKDHCVWCNELNNIHKVLNNPGELKNE